MNPFTERGRIVDPARFIGRWSELSVIFDRIAMGRPVLVSGIAGIGRSSLLTHIAQSAAVNLERPDLGAYYIDLAKLDTPNECYRLMNKALGGMGDSGPALEITLLETDRAAIFCLDNADRAIAAGWGSSLLDTLARTARRSISLTTTGGAPGSVPPVDAPVGTRVQGKAGGEYMLHIVAAVQGRAPQIDSAYATVGLGALAATEVRLLTDAYLEGTEITFTPVDLREIYTLSMGHPAYLQRAAFHLFRAYTQSGYDWRAAYQEEVTDQPVPGAPLPPAVFRGDEVADLASFYYGDETIELRRQAPEKADIGGMGDLMLALLPLIAALVAWQISASWLVAVVVLLVGVGLTVLARRVRPTSGD